MTSRDELMRELRCKVGLQPDDCDEMFYIQVLVTPYLDIRAEVLSQLETMGSSVPWRELVDITRRLGVLIEQSVVEMFRLNARRHAPCWRKTLEPISSKLRSRSQIDYMPFRLCTYIEEEDASGIIEARRSAGLSNPSHEAASQGEVSNEWRMMESQHHNDYDVSPMEVEQCNDWLRDNCIRCEEPILHRGDALRLPHPDGGWFGCYCGFYCLARASQDQQVYEPDLMLAIVFMMEQIENTTFKHSKYYLNLLEE